MALTDWIPSALKPAVAEHGSPKGGNDYSNSLTKSESSAAKDLTSDGASKTNSSSQLSASSSSTTVQEPSPEEAKSPTIILTSGPTSSADSYSEMASKRPSGIRFAEIPSSSFIGPCRGAQRLRSRTFTQGIDTSWSASSQSSPEHTGHEFADFSAISAAGLKTFSPSFARASASAATPSDPSTRKSVARPLTPIAEPKRVFRITNPDDLPVDELGVAGLVSPSGMVSFITGVNPQDVQPTDPAQVPKIPQSPYWATGPVSPEEFDQYKEGMEVYLRDVSIRLVEAQQQLQEQSQAHENERRELQRQINDLTAANQQLTQSALTKDEERESQLYINTTDAEDSIEDYQNEEHRSISDQILELHIKVVLTRGEASRGAEDYAAMESHAEYAAQLATELIDPKAMIAHCNYHRGIALYYQEKWLLASEAFQASKDCEGVWKTASEIKDWIQKVAIKTEAIDGLSAVSRFSPQPSSAISEIFGRFGWENLGGLSSAVSKPSPSATTSAISGLFGKFGWENLGGFSALGSPETPLGSAVAPTWSTSPSGQPHLPIESSEASFYPEPDSPGSLESRISRQKGHFRSTSGLSVMSGEDSDRGPTPRPGSLTSHSASIAKPPSPLRIQKSEGRSPSYETSFKANSSGLPIPPLSYQESSRRVVDPASTTSGISSGATNAQGSKRATGGDLSRALRKLHPLEIPSSSRSSSFMASSSNQSREVISSPDRRPLPLIPGVPYPEFPDSSSSEASQQPHMPTIPHRTQPLRVINRSSLTPEASSSPAVASSDPRAVPDGKPAFPDHTGPLRVNAPSTPKNSSASTRSSSAFSSRLISFPRGVTPLRTMDHGSPTPELSPSPLESSSGLQSASSSPAAQGKQIQALGADGEDVGATTEVSSPAHVGSDRADVTKMVPGRLEFTNAASAPEAKPEHDETEKSANLSGFEEQEADEKAAEVVRKVLGTGEEGSSADWGSNEEQALTDYLVGGDGDAEIKDEGRDENRIESGNGDEGEAKVGK